MTLYRKFQKSLIPWDMCKPSSRNTYLCKLAKPPFQQSLWTYSARGFSPQRMIFPLPAFPVVRVLSIMKCLKEMYVISLFGKMADHG